MPSSNRYSSSWVSPDPGSPPSPAFSPANSGWDLEEGDDLHPAANVAKMHAGIPLTDDDRWPWLDSVAAWITEHTRAGLPGIITCSALKRIYRDRMRGDNVVFVHLAGNKETIERRLNARMDHFMPPTLLDSQINTLEPPGPGREHPGRRSRPQARRRGRRDHRTARPARRAGLIDARLHPSRDLVRTAARRPLGGPGATLQLTFGGQCPRNASASHHEPLSSLTLASTTSGAARGPASHARTASRSAAVRTVTPAAP